MYTRTELDLTRRIVGRGHVRIDPFRRRDVGFAAAYVPVRAARKPARVERIGVGGIEAGGLAEVGERARVVFEPVPGLTAVEVGGGCLIGGQPDCFAEVGDGALVVVLPAPDEAAIVEGPGVVRLEPDHLIEVGKGMSVLASVREGG